MSSGLSEIAAGLSPAMRKFLVEASDLTDTYNDGQGPEATAQRAERLGYAHIHAWKGYWQVCLIGDGLALRECLRGEVQP